MARNAKDLDLVLHIGLHKTATTYLQNVLTARRYDLIQHGILYPTTGASETRMRTRDGAQAGHFDLTFRKGRPELLEELLDEVPGGVSTVLLSAEDLTHPRSSPEDHLEHFGIFGTIRVVVVLRRQDTWIESIYKQAVDQWSDFETRSLPDFVVDRAPALMDFRRRLSPWRQLVGPENFHVLSYDDLPDGAEILRRILEIAGVPRERLNEYPGVDAARYDSIRAIDTLGLRILNGYRLQTRDIRNKIAREIYACAPAGDIELMPPELRTAITERYAQVNEQIEAEWFTEPVPGFRFGADLRREPPQLPSAQDLVEYVNQVVALCDSARALDFAATADVDLASLPPRAASRRRAALGMLAAEDAGAAEEFDSADETGALDETGAVE